MMSMKMKKEEAMYSMNKTFQETNLKDCGSKELVKWRENIDVGKWSFSYH